VKLIPLGGEYGRGMFATVDDGDAELVAGYAWHLWEDPDGSGRRYAVAYVRGSGRAGQRTIKMHQLIMGRASIDHRDGDGLNNTRRNLRPTTDQLNQANSVSRTGTSQYKGVYWKRWNSGSRGKWRAAITVEGRNRHLGYFTDEAAAARAYDTAALAEWGDHARLNFPPVGQPSARP
jgi:hypothetical protein